jgi:hypothetical protein
MKGSNGANLSFPDEFNISTTLPDSDPNLVKNEWLVGTINSGYTLYLSPEHANRVSQSIYRLCLARLLANRSVESLPRSSRHPVLVWHFLYFLCHRLRFCKDMAPASRHTSSAGFGNGYHDLFTFSALNSPQVRKHARHPSSTPKTCQLLYVEAWLCLGRCGWVMCLFCGFLH